MHCGTDCVDCVDSISVLVRWEDTLWCSVCWLCGQYKCVGEVRRYTVVLCVLTVSVCWWGEKIHCGTVCVVLYSEYIYSVSVLVKCEDTLWYMSWLCQCVCERTEYTDVQCVLTVWTGSVCWWQERIHWYTVCNCVDWVSVLVKGEDTLMYSVCGLGQCVGDRRRYTDVQCVLTVWTGSVFWSQEKIHWCTVCVDWVSVLVTGEDTLMYSVCWLCGLGQCVGDRRRYTDVQCVLTGWTGSVCWWQERIHWCTVFVDCVDWVSVLVTGEDTLMYSVCWLCGLGQCVGDRRRYTDVQCLLTVWTGSVCWWQERIHWCTVCVDWVSVLVKEEDIDSQCVWPVLVLTVLIVSVC